MIIIMKMTIGGRNDTEQKWDLKILVKVLCAPLNCKYTLGMDSHKRLLQF